MKLRVLRCALIVLSAMLLTAPTAGARVITYEFTGSITSMTPEAVGIFDFSQTLYGSFSYEDATPAARDLGWATLYHRAITAMSITIGEYKMSLSSPDSQAITVSNESYMDYVVFSAELTRVAGDFAPDILLSLEDPTGAMLSGEGLADIPDLTGRTASGYGTDFHYSLSIGNPRISGPITSLAMDTQTPEPAAFGTACAALVLLAGRRLRRAAGPASS